MDIIRRKGDDYAAVEDKAFMTYSKECYIDNPVGAFLHGCYLYRCQDYVGASKAFKAVLKMREIGKNDVRPQANALEYETRFNLGTCLFKMHDFKSC